MAKLAQFLIYLLFIAVVVLVASFSRAGKLNPVRGKNRSVETILESNKNVNEQPKFYRFWLLSAFFLLWLFYTLSGKHVGTDMFTYGWLFDTAVSDFEYYMRISDMEPFFHVFNFIIRSITSNFYIYKGICGFIILLGPYKIIYKFRNDLSVPLALYIYLLVAYFEAFNLMRLSIALSFVLMGVVKGYDGKYIRNILYCLAGCLFHFSALIAVGFAVLYAIYVKLLKNRKIIYFMLCIIAVAIILPSATLVLEILGLRRYAEYLMSFQNIDFINFWFVSYLFPFFILFFYAAKTKGWKIHNQYGFYLLNSLILRIVSFFIEIATRAIMYTASYNIIFLPVLLKSNSISRDERFILTLATVIWYTFWFGYAFFGAGFFATFEWSFNV